jgi:arylsulfatase A-like enzyme
MHCLVKTDKGRDDLIIEATTRTAYRSGDWLLIPPYKGPAKNELVNIELGNSDEYQLYNLREDISQMNNLAKINADELQELIAEFEKQKGKENLETKPLELK